MTVDRAAGVIAIRIDAQDDFGYLTPISFFGVGVEKPQVGREMPAVVLRQTRIGRGRIGDGGSERQFRHGVLEKRMGLRTQRMRERKDYATV